MARRKGPRPEELLMLSMAKGVALLLGAMQGHSGEIHQVRNDLNRSVKEIEDRIKEDEDERAAG